MKQFELLPHTADIKIRVWADSKQGLFKHALIGMFQAIGPHAEGCIRKDDLLVCERLPEAHEVEVSSSDVESLLVDFLSEALWFSDVYNQAYLDSDIHEFSDTHIKATIFGVTVTGFDRVEIKAVTYHDLYIKNIDNRWQAEIVFDI